VPDFIRWLRKFFKPLPIEQRREVVSDLIPSVSPGFDFFLLVVLSSSIATLGLITDSAAVIIGAMLLAPLMSPIIGIGMASITGSPLLLRNSISALLRGALLAIFLASSITIINNHLPFINIQELPKEILTRTRPTPIDLAIALAGGLAAAYALTQPNLSAALPGVAIATALMPPLCTVGISIALGRWDLTGGAALLFITNAITIAFAAVLVFFLRGFGSSPTVAVHRLPRSLLFSASLTLLLLIPLSFFSIKFFQEAAENRRVQTIVNHEILSLKSVELVSMALSHNDTTMDIVLTLRTNSPLLYEQVVSLQEAIVKQLGKPASLKINQIFAERLDPLIPPTPTFTPTASRTYTPGPSPTASRTPTYSPTTTRTMTASATFPPTHTLTPTATSAPIRIRIPTLPKVQLYQYPNGPHIGKISNGQTLTLLGNREVNAGMTWVEVLDEEGRIGWVPEIYTYVISPTPTSTASPIPIPPP